MLSLKVLLFHKPKNKGRLSAGCNATKIVAGFERIHSKINATILHHNRVVFNPSTLAIINCNGNLSEKLTWSATVILSVAGLGKTKAS